MDVHEGREFSGELVAELKADLAVGEAGPDFRVRYVLRGEVDLRIGLGDELLGDEKVVLLAQPGGDIAVVADER